jgi:hypothetical protein
VFFQILTGKTQPRNTLGGGGDRWGVLLMGVVLLKRVSMCRVTPKQKWLCSFELCFVEKDRKEFDACSFLKMNERSQFLEPHVIQRKNSENCDDKDHEMYSAATVS